MIKAVANTTVLCSLKKTGIMVDISTTTTAMQYLNYKAFISEGGFD